MATLRITRLRCIKKRDPIGKDEIDIYLTVDDGTEFFLSGPHFIDKSKNDEIVELQENRDFTTSITVRLRERNGERGGNNDRDLGSEPFDPVAVGSHPYSFGTDGGGVSYELTASVTT